MVNKLYEFREKNMNGNRVIGTLEKINDLHNTAKLMSAGFIKLTEESAGIGGAAV